jgi:hypothetical protein
MRIIGHGFNFEEFIAFVCLFWFLFLHLFQTAEFGLVGLVASFVALVACSADVVADIAFAPLPVELFLDELDYAFLFGLDPGLFFAETVQFGLTVGDLLAETVGVADAGVGVSVPDVEDGDEDVPAQVVEGLGTVGRQFSGVVLVLSVVQGVSGVLEDIEVFDLILGVSGALGQFVLLEHAFVGVVDLLLAIVQPIPH